MKVYVSVDNHFSETKPVKQIPAIKGRTSKRWQEIELSELADLVGNKGHAMIPAHLVGGISADCCKSMQVFALDFDQGCGFDDIKSRCEQMNLPIAFAYHTYSSSEEKERFRVVFAYECLIEDVFIIRIIVMMLLKLFPESDQMCKNLDRMYLGGKSLIYSNCEARFAMVQLLFPVYDALNVAENFKRNVRAFGIKNRILLINDRLAIGEKKMLESMIDFDGIMDSSIIHNIVGSANPSFSVIESKNGMHQSIRCKQKSKKLDVRESDSCQLLNDFNDGIEIDHMGRFAILTNLMRITGGEKHFFEVLEKYYETESVDKWKKYVFYMREYFPQRCSETFCPYYGTCENAGTIVETLALDRKVKRKREKLYSIEEAQNCLTENLQKAFLSPNRGIHLIKAQTGIGKTTVYIEMIRNNPDKKFIVALPTNQLKEDVYKRFRNVGIAEREIFMTKSIRGNSFFPIEIQEAISGYHNQGIHNQTKKIVKDYYKEIKKAPGKIAVAKECELIMEGIKAVKGERIIVTTHAYLLSMPKEFLEQYMVIIDEDILQLNMMSGIFSISINCLQELAEKKWPPYSEIAVQMLEAEEGVCHKSQKRQFAEPLEMEQMKELVNYDGDNINDLVCAGSFVKMMDRHTGNMVVKYFCPQKLPIIKYIILSATLNENIYREYFSNKMCVYSYPEKKAKYKGKLIQYTYHSLGRRDLKNKKQVFQHIRKISGEENLEIITFKENQKLQGISDMNMAGIHFGNSTGINDLEGKDIGIIGTPYKPPEVYKLIACYLGADVNQKLDEHPKMRRIEYNQCSFLITTYNNSLLRELMLYSIESELEQCIGRARLLRNDCNVYLFSCFPCEQAEIYIKNYLE